MAEVRPVVRLEGITKSYGTGTGAAVEVLHGIDARLDPGEFVALIGPSGSGKSTLLNIIGLLDRPTSGRLMIDGEATASLSDAAITHLRSRSIGFVFQQPCLLSAFTALENVMMPMLVDRHFPDDAMRTRAAQLLDEMGLAKQAGNPSNNLSGGQQQRVSIARALAMNPSLILADEPTGNLDSKAAEAVLTLMRKVNAENGTSFLIVTHNDALAARCDRVLELVDGALTESHVVVQDSRVTRDGSPDAQVGRVRADP